MSKVPTLMDLINQDLQKYVGQIIQSRVRSNHTGVITKIAIDNFDELSVEMLKSDGKEQSVDYADNVYSDKYITIAKLAGKLNE